MSPKNTSPWFNSVPDKKSYEKLTKNIEADVVVIGGGIVGILSAYKLVKAGYNVVLLEKNHIATGDTGYTTGFLTKIPERHLNDIEKTYGSKFAKNIYNLGIESQNELFKIIKDENIECDFKECETIFGAYEQQSKFMRKEFKTIQKLDSSSKMLGKNDLKDVPFKSAIKITKEGQFNSREFIFGLLKKIEGKTFKIFEESEVIDINFSSKEVIIKTDEGSVKASKVIAAIGNPSSLFDELSDLVEGKITYVIGAKFKEKAPLDDNLYWDNNTPYFYFRKISEDTLILGGCDIAFDKVKTQKPFEVLEKYLKDNFKGDYELVYKWSGNIFYSIDELPYAFTHPSFKKKLYVVAGLSGSGLIFGNLMASVVMDMIQNKDSERVSMFNISRTKSQINQKDFGKLKSKEDLKESDAPKEYVKVAKTSDLENNNVFCVTINNKEIAIFKVKNRLYALNNTCTHMGGPLCEGHLDGEVIECPWHGGRFNVTTGEVVEGPPSRAEKTYNVRINGDDVELEIAQDKVLQPLVQKPIVKSAEEVLKNDKEKKTKNLIFFTIFAFGFWIIQFLYQYLSFTKDDLENSLLRSFALTGATLIGFALFSSAIFKWHPKWAKHWRTRRHLGVAGFTFIFFHVISAYYFLFDFRFKDVYYSLNPLENPIVFGSMAFPIFMLMALTSTDWAVRKLTFKWWKFIHRFVYFAYAFAIFHFTQVNPALLDNYAGYFLILITSLAVFGQLFWFIVTIIQRRFRTYGVLVGALVIAVYIFFGFHAWTETIKPYLERADLEDDIRAMLEYLDENEGNTPTLDVAPAQKFRPTDLKTGEFKEINSTTEGQASLSQKGELYYVSFEDDFKSPSGPDLYVYLTKNTRLTTRDDIKNGIELGKLESTDGKQVYFVGEVDDIEDYNSVTIFSKKFEVPWSFARLK